ncbi:MAG TPA: hypothetical protein VHT96_07590 [Clostridia bacterium]|nr:hypothetical protein [Clostridia bacterium]
MRIKRIISVGLSAIIITLAFSACTSNSSEQNTQTESTLSSGIEASGEQQANAAPQKEVVSQEVAKPDTKASVDDLTGSWTDKNDKTRFINISKDGDGYIYEDNEGKLQTEYKDGVLELKISDTDTAKVYIDEASGHLMLVYQDNISEYEKK